VLVAGASGLVGSETVRRFSADGWDVIAVSRRPPAVSFGPGDVRHLAVDLLDGAASRAALADVRVSHVVYAALFEKPGLIGGWRERDQMEANATMLRNLMEPLGEEVEHVSLLQGTKAYGVHLHPIPLPARERAPRDEHENFYWLQEDYLRGLCRERGGQMTVLRPQVIFGGCVGVAMNLLPVVGAFAALCVREGIPFAYPGGPMYPQEGVDSRLMAAALRWCATAPAAREETFNITNGDVFHWRGLWPAMAAALGVEAVPDERRSMVEFLSSRESAWQEVVREYDLLPSTLASLCGESHHYADFQFGYDLAEEPPYGLVSTVKLRQAGFGECFDTEDTVTYWLRDLIRRRIVPSLA
jgi:nucleoside-diphosphate-sugar epimerase